MTVILIMMAVFILSHSCKLLIMEGKYVFRKRDSKWDRERELTLYDILFGRVSARILSWVIH